MNNIFPQLNLFKVMIPIVPVILLNEPTDPVTFVVRVPPSILMGKLKEPFEIAYDAPESRCTMWPEEKQNEPDPLIARSILNPVTVPLLITTSSKSVS